MFGGQINSIGIEIEFNKADQQGAKHFLMDKGIDARITDDASCTKQSFVLGGIEIDMDTINKNPIVNNYIKKRITGGEFVSPVISSNKNDKKWFNPIESFINYLSGQGEVPSLVTGIHVHMEMGGTKLINIDTLHGALKIWRKIEAAIYRITSGEMGFSRGGKHLSYCYYRPLVPMNGPAVINDNIGDSYSSFNIDTLLRTNNVHEFMQSLGRSDNSGGKYWATKYHALNFYSLMTKGTWELRTANFTNNPRFVYAWIKVLQQLAALAVASSVYPVELNDYPDQPLGYNGDFTVNDLVTILKITDGEVIGILEELWSITSWAEPVKGYQRSHLGNGLGRNMPPTIVNWKNMRKEIIPPKVETNEIVYKPEDFIGDASVTAIAENLGNTRRNNKLELTWNRPLGMNIPQPLEFIRDEDIEEEDDEDDVIDFTDEEEFNEEDDD